jgi:hypothetical protein
LQFHSFLGFSSQDHMLLHLHSKWNVYLVVTFNPSAKTSLILLFVGSIRLGNFCSFIIISFSQKHHSFFQSFKSSLKERKSIPAQ